MPNKEIYRKIYINRINKVIDYIDSHLEYEINLNTLAETASFSPFHFHRIFKALIGETPNSYINRIRLEKAARILVQNPEVTVSETASICGFNSDSVFCRNFKSHFGMSSMEFVNKNHKEYEQIIRQVKSKIDQPERKKYQSGENPPPYLSLSINNKMRSIMKKQIEVKELAPMKLVYIRHTGAFDQIGKAYEKLFKWAGSRGLLNHDEIHSATVYHDDPKITDIDKLRQSACLVVDEKIKPEGEYGYMELPGGKHLVGNFEIDVMEFEDAWNIMCVELSESGYQPSEGLPFEYYYKDPEDHPENKFVLDICIPVKPV